MPVRLKAKHTAVISYFGMCKIHTVCLSTLIKGKSRPVIRRILSVRQRYASITTGGRILHVHPRKLSFRGHVQGFVRASDTYFRVSFTADRPRDNAILERTVLHEKLPITSENVPQLSERYNGSIREQLSLLKLYEPTSIIDCDKVLNSFSN